MKIRINTLISILACAELSNAQVIPHPEKHHFYFEAGVTQSKVKNENMDWDKTIHTESTIQPDLGIGYSKLLGRNTFFYFGFKYREFATLITCKGAFKNAELKVDKDNYLYYLLTEADYTDKMHITTLTLPIGIKFIIGNPGHCRLLLQAAIEPTFFIKSNEERKGSMETKGMYPDAQYINVVHVINNIPSYGYYAQSVRDKKIPNSGMVWGFSTGVGCTAPVNSTVDLTFILGYYTSAGDLINKNDRGSNYKNLEGSTRGYKKTSLSSVSINIGLTIKKI